MVLDAGACSDQGLGTLLCSPWVLSLPDIGLGCGFLFPDPECVGSQGQPFAMSGHLLGSPRAGLDPWPLAPALAHSPIQRGRRKVFMLKLIYSRMKSHVVAMAKIRAR